MSDADSRSQVRLSGSSLVRGLGVTALVATGVCTVIGGGINVLSVQVQTTTPGIGGSVPLAFALGAVPAFVTALCYAIIATAMPRAGGDYTYISRALHPFVGFLAAFSKWFGLSAACGLIGVMSVALLQAAAEYMGAAGAAELLRANTGVLILGLAMVWLFWLVNILGVRTYGAVVIVLMVLMLAGGAVLVVYALAGSHEAFAAAWQARYGTDVHATIARTSVPRGGISNLIRATTFLFFAYIGFATISQAGGEAKDPRRTLPKAFVWSLVIISGYYMIFSFSLYKAVPWKFVYHLLQTPQWQDTLSAPHVVGVLMPPALTVVVALAAALTLANDIPPMLLAVSRLFFSWARDGIFPPALAAVNRRFGTPHCALTISALVSSAVVLLCVYGPQRFGSAVDIVNVALLTTYCLAGVSVLSFPRRAPKLYQQVSFIRARWAQIMLGLLCILTIAPLLLTQIWADLSASDWTLTDLAWRPTVWWLIVMVAGSIVFGAMWWRRRRQGWDLRAMFESLPDETETQPAL